MRSNGGAVWARVRGRAFWRWLGTLKLWQQLGIVMDFVGLGDGKIAAAWLKRRRWDLWRREARVMRTGEATV